MLIRRMQASDVKAVADLARRNYDGVLAEYHSPPVVARFRAEVTVESLRRVSRRPSSSTSSSSASPSSAPDPRGT